MQQRRWFVIVGIGLPVLLCLYVAVCGFVGFFWGRWASTEAGASGLALNPDVTPAVTPVYRQPMPVEHETAHLVTKVTLPGRDLFDLARRFQGLPDDTTWQVATEPPTYDLGDALVFWVHDVGNNSYFTATATLRYATPHAYWWVESDYDVPSKALQRSAEAFENHTYPTNLHFFGSEWSPGIDGDPHVYIYLGSVPGVGGYFSGPDSYPVVVRPYSNEHEMFYINLDNAMPGNDYFDGILAHEHQHMIHWAQDRDESTWVNEGLSELASHLCGYDVGGSDFMFTESPNTQLTAWPDLEDSGPHYGASYVFLTYFWEQYGDQAVRSLVSEQANGIEGFEAVLADLDPGRSFDNLFTDWVVANYLDDLTLADGRYGYANLDISRPRHAAHHQAYPVHEQAIVHQYAADYIVLQGRGDLTIEFTGTRAVSLLGNETHSGKYQWWSNRGDDSNTRLTRAFDLTDLESATLQVWMWYHLEVDYDYAYVSVSTDGGDTWDLLANEHTTTTNPSGNSYGPALNGLSGGGDEPAWNLETFDLNPYVGQPILLRFEVVTDEAVNHPGLSIDDISIPELNYFYDAENGDDGWQAEGWLRVTDHVPQEFVVQVIRLGRETTVERMALNEQMQGTIRIAGVGHDIDRAVLVVSALAPVTTEKAAYSYQIRQE